MIDTGMINIALRAENRDHQLGKLKESESVLKNEDNVISEGGTPKVEGDIRVSERPVMIPASGPVSDNGK
jgi:hypothetical protein